MRVSFAHVGSVSRLSRSEGLVRLVAGTGPRPRAGPEVELGASTDVAGRQGAVGCER
jgi:hypothetical protein